jgi:hypothetical protein
MKRLVFLMVLLAGAPAWAFTERLLIAAASVQGQALFQSDVRIFNPSYTDTITVTPIYLYCSPCQSIKQMDPFDIPPRQAVKYDNIVVTLFNLPNTQGAILFTTPADDLVVTSRLYSNSLVCEGSVGQFVPGVEDSERRARAVMTSLKQNADFRTNIVLYNPSAPLPVTVRVFDGDTGMQIGSNYSFTMLSGFFPSTNLFTLVGASGVTSDNAYATVLAADFFPGHGIYSAASVLDNHSQDTIFVKGEQDTTPP